MSVYAALAPQLYNAHFDTEDAEGADYADLAQARATALEGIRSLLSAEVKEGKLNLVGHLDIVDDGGAVLQTITFSEALSITSP